MDGACVTEPLVTRDRLEHSVVLGKALEVVTYEVPVTCGDRTSVLTKPHLRVEFAALAEIGHLVYVCTASRIGFGRHLTAIGKQRHPDHIRWHYPRGAINKGVNKPVIDLFGAKPALHEDIAKDHEPRNVMGPTGFVDLVNRPGQTVRFDIA